MARETLEREVTTLRAPISAYEKITSDQEFKVSTRQRKRIANAIYLYFLHPTTRNSVNTRFDDAHRTICQDVSVKIRNVLGRKFEERMRRFREGEEPFLIVRNIVPVPMGFPTDPWRLEDKISEQRRSQSGEGLGRARRRLRNIDSVIGSLLWTLGSSPEPRFLTATNRRGVNFLTRWDGQEHFDTKSADIPLRFHQSVVEQPLPERAPRIGDTALFKAYAAIRNPRRLPIEILPVDTILNCVTDELLDESGKRGVIEILSEPIFDKIGPRLELADISDMRHQGRILSEIAGTKIMGFDAARVWPVNNDRLGVRAIRALRDAIHQASRTQSYQIKLARHDLLLVNNLRAMVARHEDSPAAVELANIIPSHRRRWLRTMYGFPKEDVSRMDAAASTSLSGGA